MRFFSSYLFLLVSSYFFCSHLSAASTGTLTVRFGQTTEDTFKASHPEAVNVGFNNELRGNIYKEMPNDNKEVRKDIIFETIQTVFVLFDQNQNLIALHLQFNQDQFSVISSILTKKYTTTVKKTSFIGGEYIEMVNEGVSIYLMRPFFFSNTSLFYIKTDVKNEILKSTSTDLLKDENEMLNYIVKICFPSIE